MDVVLGQPAALVELKWSYELPGKVLESLWDAIKLALLGEALDYDDLYIVTGASDQEWRTSESAELFEDGTADALEMWRRQLAPRRGPNNGATIGEDLVIGARGNRPLRGHPLLAVRALGRFRVGPNFELRVARIAPAAPTVTWPAVATTSEVVREHRFLVEHPNGRFALPARVTQAWIERTASALPPGSVPAFLAALRERGWSTSDLRDRVMPYLPPADRSRGR